MAEDLLLKFEEQLKCFSCGQIYTLPKQLTCQHMFCLDCLNNTIKPDQQSKLGLTCPTCYMVTPLPTKGIAELPPAVYISQFLDVRDAIEKVGYPERELHCPVHPAEKVECYCTQCHEVVCKNCLLKIDGSQHCQHNHEFFQDGVCTYQKNMGESVQALDKQLQETKNGIDALETRRREVSEQSGSIEEDVKKMFAQLRAALDDREKEVLTQLGQMTEGKLDNLALQTRRLETTKELLSQCLELVQSTLKLENSKGGMLLLATPMVSKVDELTETFEKTKEQLFEVSVEADMKFVHDEPQIPPVCHTYGQMVSPSLPDNSQWLVTIPDDAAVGKVSTFEIKKSKSMKKYSKKEILIECHLVCEGSQARVRCGVERDRNSKFRVSFQPSTAGTHKLHVKVEGQQIPGSPYSVAVPSTSVYSIGTVLHGAQ